MWQRSARIRVTRELKPVGVSEPGSGVFVFDFGQNVAGWCRLVASEGSRCESVVAARRNANTNGTVFTGNLHLFNNADRQFDEYTFKDSQPVVFEPHFTYHGFRYVEVRGLSGKPSLNNLTAMVFNSDCPEVGSFTCSEPLLTRLAQNILWSQRANYMGVPTDCPQRDERCGYPGDAQFFMPTAIYNMDVAAFFNKCLVDLCEDSANPTNGAFGEITCPTLPVPAAMAMSAGATPDICPWLFYRTYGDVRLLREHYDAMRRHMEFWIQRDGEKSDAGGIRDSGGPLNWLNLNSKTESQVIADGLLCRSDMMSEIAKIIWSAG